MKECLSPENLILYADGTLPDDRRKEAESHLSSCAKCRREAERLDFLFRRLETFSLCPDGNALSEYSSSSSDVSCLIIGKHAEYCASCASDIMKMEQAEKAFEQAEPDRQAIPSGLLKRLSEIYPKERRGIWDSVKDFFKRKKAAAYASSALIAACAFAVFNMYLVPDMAKTAVMPAVREVTAEKSAMDMRALEENSTQDYSEVSGVSYPEKNGDGFSDLNDGKGGSVSGLHEIAKKTALKKNASVATYKAPDNNRQPSFRQTHKPAGVIMASVCVNSGRRSQAASAAGMDKVPEPAQNPVKSDTMPDSVNYADFTDMDDAANESAMETADSRHTDIFDNRGQSLGDYEEESDEDDLLSDIAMLFEDSMEDAPQQPHYMQAESARMASPMVMPEQPAMGAAPCTPMTLSKRVNPSERHLSAKAEIQGMVDGILGAGAAEVQEYSHMHFMIKLFRAITLKEERKLGNLKSEFPHARIDISHKL